MRYPVAKKPASLEQTVEAILQERAAAARSRLFTVPLPMLLRATGLGPSSVPALLSLILKACESNSYKLVRVYARRKSNKNLWSSLGVEVVPHSRSLLIFAKTRKRKRAVTRAIINVPS